MSDELTGKSAAELARLVRGREVSPVELVEAYLRRIEELNPSLNAVVTLAKDASEQARRAEAELMRGNAVGALHGVPLTVKETIDVGGLRSTCGSTVRADFVATADAPAVARLRAAGAIILGKTNASELALDYTTENPVYGRTNHPQDESLTPGGSSGGCAAAVAAHLTAASLGSDLAGSVRIPAHFCGVAALKPTAGRVPGAGHCPPMVGAYTLGASLGPIARRVEDLSLLFEVLSTSQGSRLAADAGVRTAGRGSNSSAESGGDELELARARLRGRRLAWYTDDGSTPVTPETRAAVERAARSLANAGMNVVEERPPGVERATELWVGLFSYATQEFVRSIYEGREAEAGAQARVMLERARGGVPPTLAEFFRIWAERDRLREVLLEWMETRPLLLAPVGAMPAFRHDSPRTFALDGKLFGLFRAFSYAQAFNVFDLPALSVPAGRSPENLPIGVQLVGEPFAEASILDAARIVEDALSLSFGRGNRI